jgi:hypothetical protein
VAGKRREPDSYLPITGPSAIRRFAFREEHVSLGVWLPRVAWESSGDQRAVMADGTNGRMS